MEEKKICPICRFPERISGSVFISNKDPSEYVRLKKLRCKLCRHLPDYEIISINPKQARIIYRNFDNSVMHFQLVKDYLKENNFEVVK